MAQLYRTTKAKTVAAAVGTFTAVLTAVFADDVLDTSEVGSLIAGGIVAVGAIYAVFQTPNKPTS
jgi:hypothetical protein